MKPHVLILPLVLLLTASAVGAQEAGDVEVFEKEQASLDKFYTSNFHSYCETKAPAVIDRKSFSAVVKAAAGKDLDLDGYCGEALNGLRNLCSTGWKDDVNKQVTAFRCAHSDAPAKAALDGTTLVLATNLSPDGGGRDEVERLVAGVLRSGAFSIAQARLIKDQERRFGVALETFAGACDTTLKTSIDWSGAVGALDVAATKTESASLYEHCAAPVRALTKVCQEHSSNGALVKAQVQTYSCAFAPESGEHALSLEKGTLAYSAPYAPKADHRIVPLEIGLLVRDGDFGVGETGYLRHEDKQLANEVTRFKDKCGYDIDASIKWKTFAAVLDDRIETTTYDIASDCDDVLQRLMEVCDTNRAKIVKRKVKTFECQYTSKKKGSVSLKKKALTYKTALNAKSYSAVDKFLVKKRIMKRKPKTRAMTNAEVRKALATSPGQRCRSRCSFQCSGGKGASKCRKRCRAKCR